MQFSLSLVGALLLTHHAHAQGCPAVRPVTTVITVSALPSGGVGLEPVPETTAPVESPDENTASVSASPTTDVEVGTTSLPDVSATSSSDASTSLPFQTSVSYSLSSFSQSSMPTTLLTSTRPVTSVGATSELSSLLSETASSSTEIPVESTSETISATTFSSTSSSSTTIAPTSTSIARTYPADVVDQLRDASISKLESYLKQKPASSGCTLETASVRREWTDLSVAQREAYIAAVKCLQSAPSKSSASEVPGARSRFDDFVAVHIQQTDAIHNTANFLAWHRYFVFTYERALRDECGYAGAHPYWNWDRYAADPAASPLFNGNASSLSGDSVSSGACVATGPFANLQVNLGPGKSLAYNPRCMTRAISKSYAAMTTADKTYSLIEGSSSIAAFQNTLQAVPGVHAGGHFTIGGTPGGDIYSSPGDPAFYLHHAMVDRVWWIWQMQDLATRLTAIAGSVAGSSRQGSASDTVGLGVNAGSVEIGDLLNTLGGLGGEFCYIYL